MADIKVSYNCGCGFRTENVVEAVLHSDDSIHSLDVVGRITRDKPKARQLETTEPMKEG